jgi:outer membrane protein
MPQTTTYNRHIDFLFSEFPHPSGRLTVAKSDLAIRLKEPTISMSGKTKFHICAFALGLSIVLSTAAFAQAAAPAQPSSAASASPAKVGIVKIQDAIVGTNEGKKEFDALQSRFAPKQNELKSLSDEVDSLKKDLAAKGETLNDEERAKRIKTLDAKQKTLQRNYDDAQNEFQQAEQEVMNRIGGKMLNVLDKYGKENGYSVILDVSNPQTPVLWAKEGIEITKDLVDAYNAEFPIGAPAPAAKPTSGAAANRTPGAAPTPKKP